MADFSELKLDGRVATPDDSDWDEARQAWNLAADQSPGAVAFAESADDVAKVIRFAASAATGLRGREPGTARSRSAPSDDTILVKTERMRGVEVDPDAKTARVDAGVLARELGQAAHKRGSTRCPAPRPTLGWSGSPWRRNGLAGAAPRLRLQPGRARSTW